MRIVFLLLALANVAFLAYAKFFADARSFESQLLDQQLKPEAIRLLSPAEVASRAQKRADAPRTVACLEWGAFSVVDAARAQEALGPLALGERLSQRVMEDAAGFWVYIPTQGSRQTAIQKASELKRLGVSEFFIVQEDPRIRFAISLGVFKTAEAAKAHLEQLRAKGVRTALMGPRDSQVQKIFLQVRGIPEAIAANLNELKQGFPGTDVKPCAADDKKS